MNDDTSVYEFPLQCRHNERDCVSTHRHLDFLFNRLFRRRPNKTSKLRVTSLCKGNSPRIFSIWWRHHALPQISGKLEYWKPRSPSLEEDAPGVLLCGRHVSPGVKIPVGVTTASRVLEISSCFFNISGMSQNNFTVNLQFYPTLSEPINGLGIFPPSSLNLANLFQYEYHPSKYTSITISFMKIIRDENTFTAKTTSFYWMSTLHDLISRACFGRRSVVSTVIWSVLNNYSIDIH